MPSRFRAFAVEDLARRGDVFGYSFELDRSGLKRWTLKITTQDRHRAYWEDAFEAYAREQQLSVTTRYDRGSRIVLKGYGANRAARCWLSVEESPVDGEVELAYVYQVIPSPTGLGRYLRSVTFYIQRCCRLFRGQSVWTDLDTRAT